ncbi:RB1-inducible coiled-coil protein 1-like [Tubulanus polymorphus]|uniref:RB1-inducible coiled-coil protein 1-like n=1 Tax=Tubulanus polymorphus TaxID=672921 RepID=UPI003DA252FC
MLYVFHMNTGTMLKFDIGLAMETVANLKKVIAHRQHVPEERQVLLISGGDNLEPTQRVCSYSAGTDTNPIFLFCQNTIEDGAPPISTSGGETSRSEIHDKVEATMNMSASYETVVTRAQMALALHDAAVNELKLCEQVVHDQHLQHQGWAAAVANLDDMIAYFTRWVERYKKCFEDYLENKDSFVDIVDRFDSVTELLARIPFLDKFAFACNATQLEDDGRPKCKTLLDWIETQDSRNLQDTLSICSRGLHQFDDKLLETMNQDIAAALDNASAPGMKEVKGLEDRLFKLEQFMHTSKKLVHEQGELAQGFLQNQTRASNMRDNSIFPDLCDSHKQQLQVMLKNHVRLQDCRDKCSKAKSELCLNLHTRLRWLLYVERSVSELLSRLSLDYKELERIKQTCLILEHLQRSPRIYAAIITEIYRRRHFKKQYSDWARRLSHDSQHLYSEELTRRSQIVQLVGSHFFGHLFPGLSEKPPPFATDALREFDAALPDITAEDITTLRDAVPELHDQLKVPELGIAQFLSPARKRDAVAAEVAVPDETEDVFGSIEILSPMGEEHKDCSYVRFSDKPEPTETDNENIVIVETEDDDAMFRSGESNVRSVIKRDDKPTTSSHINNNTTAASADDRALGTRAQLSVGEVLPKSRSDSDVVGDTAAVSPDTEEMSLEFATAVFYIDESMPSSMADSPPMRTRINELQAIVNEKTSLIEQQLNQLQTKDEVVAETERRFRSLRDLADSKIGDLKDDLSSTKEMVENEKAEFSEFVGVVDKTIIEMIGQFDCRKNVQNQRLIDEVKLEYAEKISGLEKELVEKSELFEKAEKQLKTLREKLTSSETQLKVSTEEHERNILDLRAAHEESNQKVIKELTLEHEVDIEKLQSDFAKELQSANDEIDAVKNELLEKQREKERAENELENLSRTLRETFESEKESLVQVMHEEFKLEKECAVSLAVSNLEKKHKEKLNSLRDDHKSALDEARAEVTDEVTRQVKEDKEREIELLKEAHQNELEKLTQSQREEIERLKEEMEAEKREALDSVSHSMTESHKQDIEILRSELEKQKRLSLESPVSDKWQEEKDFDIAAALEKQKVEFEEKMSSLKCKYEQEKIDGIKTVRSSLIAERQVAFNEAISRLSNEKDRIIDELRQRERKLVEELDAEKELNQKLAEEQAVIADKKDVAPATLMTSQSEASGLSAMCASVIPVREFSSDTQNPIDRIHELEATLKNKEEEFARMQQKMMELSMTQSTRMIVQQHDKVSITTCNIGDLVLLCLDERHDHYVVFTVGTTLHFLHSDCLTTLGLKPESGEAKKSWVLAEIIDKEYCQARKPQNRFKVPVGTKFYRVKAVPWDRDIGEASTGAAKKETPSTSGLTGGPSMK